MILSEKEQFELYMKFPKEELIKMLIETNRAVEIMSSVVSRAKFLSSNPDSEYIKEKCETIE